MGQQSLQGFHLPSSAFLLSLYETRLEPTPVVMSRWPVDGLPLDCLVGSCTSRRWPRRPVRCLLRRFGTCSRHDRPAGSQPTVVSGEVAWWLNLSPCCSHMAFACSILLSPQPYQLAFRCAFLSGGELRAYHVPLRYQRLIEELSVRRWLCGLREGKREALSQPLPLWFKPVSMFGLLVLTTVLTRSPACSISSTLAPDRLHAGSRDVASR